MLGCLLEAVGGLVVELLLRVVLLPVVLLLATPVILICGFFGPEDYRTNVAAYYARVIQVWATAWRRRHEA